MKAKQIGRFLLDNIIGIIFLFGIGDIVYAFFRLSITYGFFALGVGAIIISLILAKERSDNS